MRDGGFRHREPKRFDDDLCVTVGHMSREQAIKILDRKVKRGRKKRRDGMRPRPRSVGNTG